MYIRHKIGKEGEIIAYHYLLEKPYQILERNFSCKQGEIDIIAKDMLTQEIVFIEVKTRCNVHYGYPAEAVTRRKQEHILQVIRYYLFHNGLEKCFIRIDVIEVYLQKHNFQVNHIKQAFVNNGLFKNSF